MAKEYQIAFKIGASLNGQFGSAFRAAQGQIGSLSREFINLSKTQRDISAYQQQQAAVEKTSARLGDLQKQYDNLKAAMAESGGASVDLKNKMIDKEQKIRETTIQLEDQQKKLGGLGESLKTAGVDTQQLGEASRNVSDRLKELREQEEGNTATTREMAQAMTEAYANLRITEAIKEIGNAIKQCAEEAIAFEHAMAGVRRTVGGDDQFLSDLGETFKDLSTEIPITVDELTQIATTAGQLGIARGDVESFTTVMAKLSTTTDLTADQAATMLAQFANITGLTDYERLGSVVASLGDATATTASKVVEMSQGMAAAASQAGMSERDILAISAAVGSLGIEAQAGSTSMSTLINTLYKATETGEQLSEFASVAGMTAQQFRDAWQRDAVGALDAFIQGLNDTERNGRSAIVILDELGINNVRQTKAILGLASAGNLLSGTIAQANAAWDSNTALTEKAQVMYDTTQSKLVMLQNAFANLQIAIGDAFTPAVSMGADVMTNLLGPVTEFIEKNPALVKGIGAAVAAMGGMIAAVTAYTAYTKLAAVASAALQMSLGPIAAVTAGIAVIIGLAVALSDSAQETTESFEDLDAEFDRLNADMAEQRRVQDLVGRYRELQSELEGVQNAASGEYTMTIDAKVGATLSADALVESVEGKHVVQIDGKAIQDLEAQGFVKEGTWAEIKAKSNVIGVSEIVPDQTVTLTAKAAEKLKAAGLLDENLFENGTPTIKIQASAIASLVASGFLKPGSDVVTISGEADQDKLISTDDLVTGGGLVKIAPAVAEEDKIADADMLSDTDHTVWLVPKADGTLSVSALAPDTDVLLTIGYTNLEQAQASLDDLKKRVDSTATNLQTEQKKLTDMETRLRQLMSRRGHASGSAKSEIEEEITSLTDAVSGQKDKVAELTGEYASMQTQMGYAQAAADALAGKKAEMAEIEAELSRTTGVSIGQLSGETNEMKRQLAVIEEMARNKEQQARADALATLAKQSRVYAESVEEGKKSTEDYNAAVSERQAIEARMFNQDVTGPAIWDKDAIRGMAAAADAAQEDLADAYATANDKVNKYNAGVEAATKTQNEFIDNLVAGVVDGGMTLGEVETILRMQIPNDTRLVADTMEIVRQRTQEAAEAAEDLADAHTDTSVNVQPVLDKMNELAEAYQEAYDEAYKSISGQMELFEEMKLAQASEDPQAAVDKMISGMQSQQAYMEQYVANYKQLLEDGLDEGILSQLSDGSEESAQILADIVAGGADKIDELNTAFAGVEQGKAEFASTVADMETDFSEKMAALEKELALTVVQMDKSSEAAQAGADTVEAFATAAEGKLPRVQEAFLRVSRSVKSILGAPLNVAGYATGTPSAPPGLAIVGEQGPELVELRGGEHIHTASETRSLVSEPLMAASVTDLASGNSFSVSVSPVYNISGTASADELRSMLDTHTNDMRGMIEDMLNDIQEDQERRAYR